MSEEIHAGFCAIVGLPNVGKSTLLNRILDRHLAAVSAKPQTTRDRIVGVHTLVLPPRPDGGDARDGGGPVPAQIAYVDTPGVQDGRGPLRRYMRDAAIAAADDADVVLLLIDATDRRGRLPDRLAEADAAALSDASRRHPVVIGLNKIDRVGKPELLPMIEAWSAFAPGGEVVPISALTGDGVLALERAIAVRLPLGPPLFPEDVVTDRSPQFIAQEIIREQLYHQLGKELPYACAVQIEGWTEYPARVRSDARTRDGRRTAKQAQGEPRQAQPPPELAIQAVIVVERESQKAIVVGRGGARVRELGIAGRRAVGEALGRTVHLSLFVKVISEWSRGEAELQRLGYATRGDGP